jgi:crotonobetainyl-CoA:carnitine CoA-transferase CaiB-like acyl-CoA transferase
MFMAGGVAAELFRRCVSGVGCLVDVSLLASGVWMLAPDIISSDYRGKNPPHLEFGLLQANPLTGLYRTSDGRDILLGMLKGDRHWPDFCRAIDREDMIDDPSFDNMAKRSRNTHLVEIIRDAFRARPLEHWRERLTRSGCVWTLVQTPLEATQDPQIVANGYLVPHPTRSDARLVASPVQYDDEAVSINAGAPGLGQHTEEVLLGLGLSWADIAALKDLGVVN